MRALSRTRGFILFGLLLLAAVGYSFAAKFEPTRTPIEQVEAAVAPYKVRYDVGTFVRTGSFSDFSGPPAIYVRPVSGQVELTKNGRGVHGITEWGIGSSGPTSLQKFFIDALNDSPATAQQLMKHPDERIQFLLLRVLYDWGHNVKSVRDDKHPGQSQFVNLQPHAVEALLTFAERENPHTVGTVLGALRFKPMFSTDVFVAAMAHNSSNIRAEAVTWIDPERQQMTIAEIEAVIPILIEHLGDRDIVVREFSLTALQSLVAYWEQSLGGTPYETARDDRRKMTKLTNPQAIENWHTAVSPQLLKSAEQNQADWKAWFEAARKSTGSTADEP